jgi:DNA-binding CsgD family transcriptional regulator/PAS domain-containing protein
MDADFLARAEAMFMDAATDPDAWQAALDAVAEKSDSRGAVLLTVEGCGPFVLPTQGLGELAERYVKDGWYQHDFRRTGLPQMKQRGIMVDQDFVRPDEMNRLEFYADFLRPLGFGWFAGLKVETGDDLWCLTLQRGMAEGAYEAEEQESLLRLGGIVSRAATLARRLEFVRLDGAMDAAEALAGAVMFIDRFGKIVRLNQRAEAMVGRNFMIRQGRIRFAEASSDALQRHIDAVIWPDLSPTASAHLPVVVPQPNARPLIFQALRLRGRSQGFFSPAYAMLLVTDLNDKSTPPVDHLQTIFGLTPAEARLSHALLQQRSLADAAAHLNCTYETVRTQIKAIFAKTGTRNQAQLLDLLGRIRHA